MFDWSDIRTFLAVMSEGSAAAAARTLGTNQTTISRRIERLEAALNLRLFEPGARGAKPTANAEALLPDAQAMAAAAHALEGHVEARQRTLTGTIRVTTTPGAPRHISGLLRSFRALHPDVRFEVNADDRALSLEDGEADVAMRAAMQLTGDTLMARKLFDHAWGVYAAPSYLERRGQPRRMAELAGHSVAFYTGAVEQRLECVDDFQSKVSETDQFVRVSSVDAMLGLLLDGEGLGLLPRSAGDTEPGLELCFREPEMFQRFWLVWHPSSSASPHVDAFIRYLIDNLPGMLKSLPEDWVA